LKRRELLGAALGSALLAGCANLPVTRPPSLARPRISADRVTRVLVGLRPYRPGGFVVRAEALGSKRLVHNYGHGGAGITLSWGTARLAVDMGFTDARERHAVIGCGVVGLSTALLLQRRGASVTIYAKDLPPDTTSNIAGGHWSPTSLFDHATPEFLAQFNRAIHIAHRTFQGMAGTRHGVFWHRSYILNDSPHDFGPGHKAIRDLFPETALLNPGEHPFGDAYVQAYTTMMIEPYTYLRSLMDMFLLGGGRIEVRDFSSREQIAALPEPVIFNCTGLGAKALFGDEELTPVRGQLVVLLPQPELDYNLHANGLYMFPRTDGLVLGGTFERGNWSLEPDSETTARILEGNARLAARIA
jgi:glycine/D-amino acid oxidase-like deaminating enzyme